jgi:hypothetical protein
MLMTPVSQFSMIMMLHQMQLIFWEGVLYKFQQLPLIYSMFM